MENAIGSLAEDSFRYNHNGMTSAEWDAQFRPPVRDVRDEFEERYAAELEGEPPADICSTRGLAPKRARLARYHAWSVAEERKYSELQSLKAKMAALIDVPAATEAEIKAEVRKTAAYLMGREQTDGADTAKRRKLDDRLASERHAADAAREALAEIESKIEIAGLRLTRLRSRESEFVAPALIEAAEILGLGKLYVKKIAELKQVTDLLFGLVGAVGRVSNLYATSYTANSSSNIESVTFPVECLPLIPKPTQSGALTITSSGRTDAWKQLAHAMLMNADVDAAKFIALPK